MRFITGFIDDQITPSMVFELHKILTEGTFGEGYEHKAGVFRSAEDNICVEWEDGTTLHVPPPVSELKGRKDVFVAPPDLLDVVRRFQRWRRLA